MTATVAAVVSASRIVLSFSRDMRSIVGSVTLGMASVRGSGGVSVGHCGQPKIYRVTPLSPHESCRFAGYIYISIFPILSPVQLTTVTKNFDIQLDLHRMLYAEELGTKTDGAMAVPSLLDAKLLIFDIYGTLIDDNTGLYTAAQPLLSQLPSPPSRAEFLQVLEPRVKALQKTHGTLRYSELLSKIYTQLAAHYSLPTPSKKEAAAFGNSIGTWAPFPDSAEALVRLKKYYKLVVLSNVDRASWEKTAQLLGGDATFDLVVTAEDVGAYKPDLKGFHYVLGEVGRRWGIKPGECCSTAQGLYHDHVPAKQLGLLGAYIAREGAVMGIDVDPPREWDFKTLGEMTDAVEKEAAENS